MTLCCFDVPSQYSPVDTTTPYNGFPGNRRNHGFQQPPQMYMPTGGNALQAYDPSASYQNSGMINNGAASTQMIQGESFFFLALAIFCFRIHFSSLMINKMNILKRCSNRSRRRSSRTSSACYGSRWKWESGRSNCPSWITPRSYFYGCSSQRISE